MYEWMDGWMDRYGLLLEVMALLSRIICLFFFETWLPLFLSLFFGHASLACHLFPFWGNHNLTLFYFRDVLRERSPRHGAFINVEWMDGGANSQCRNVAIGWDVYVLMIEKA